MSLVDSVDFTTEEDRYAGWTRITNNFVLTTGEKRRMRMFIKEMHSAKIETERKMRIDLDHKILNMDPIRQMALLGKITSEKIRYLCRIFRLHG